MTDRKLVLDDIADVRAYERERDDFRREIIELKKRRRVNVGPLVTLLFENRDTVKFQVQEMARVEKIVSDDGIQSELDVYNPLIPEAGQLSATLFVELTSEADLRAWLPKLVGIEQAVMLVLADGSVVAPVTEEQHASQLTRDHVTAAVHYIRYELTPAQVEALAAGPVELRVDLAAYQASTVLGDDVVAELLADARG